MRTSNVFLGILPSVLAIVDEIAFSDPYVSSEK